MEKKDPVIGIEFGYKYSRIAICTGKHSFRPLNINTGKNFVISDLEINESGIFSIPRNINIKNSRIKQILNLIHNKNTNSEVYDILYKNEKRKYIKLKKSGKEYPIEFIVDKFFQQFFQLLENNKEFQKSQTVAITIPVYFNLEERNIVLNAVRKTKKFENIILLTEAEAALIYQKYEEEKIYLIIRINDDFVETTKIKIGNNKSRFIQKDNYFNLQTNENKKIGFTNNNQKDLNFEDYEEILKEYNIPSINEIIVVEEQEKKYHETIKKLFSQNVIVLNEQEEISYGAAKYAYNYDFKILNLSIGFDFSGTMKFIVKKGQPIPCEKKNQFTFNSCAFKNKKIKFYQGENKYSENNKFLIEFPIDFKESEIKTVNIILNITKSNKLKVKIDGQIQNCNLELDEITKIDEFNKNDEIINNLLNDIEEYQEYHEKQKQEIEKQKQEIENQKKEIKMQKKDISELKNKVLELNNKVKAMGIKEKQKDNEINELQNTQSTLFAKFQELKNEIKEMKKKKNQENSENYVSILPIELKDNKPVKNEASKIRTSNNYLLSSTQRADFHGSRNHKTK
jgi:molecular chaperone DnaK (HSP70)